MAKFVTRIAPKDNGDRCRSEDIGRQIHGLSAMKDAIKESINTSKDVTPKWENWTGQALVHAKKIVSGLCLNLIGTGNTLGPFSNINDASKIQDKVKVRFVFEEEGELIIVIPHKSTIDHGKNDSPPLNTLEKYNDFSRKKVMKSAEDDFSEEIKKLNLGSNEKKVTDAFEKVKIKNPDPNNNKKIPTFYTQLGEYSCRQCGH